MNRVALSTVSISEILQSEGTGGIFVLGFRVRKNVYSCVQDE